MDRLNKGKIGKCVLHEAQLVKKKSLRDSERILYSDCFTSDKKVTLSAPIREALWMWVIKMGRGHKLSRATLRERPGSFQRAHIYS